MAHAKGARWARKVAAAGVAPPPPPAAAAAAVAAAPPAAAPSGAAPPPGVAPPPGGCSVWLKHRARFCGQPAPAGGALCANHGGGAEPRVPCPADPRQ
jgi:hypothetical protein